MSVRAALERLGYGMSDVDAAIATINDSHETHVHWADWRRKGHGTDEDHEMVGDLAYHEAAVADYARVLNLLAVIREVLKADPVRVAHVPGCDDGCLGCAECLCHHPEAHARAALQGDADAPEPETNLRLGALPDGAYLHITGPTATPGRRYVAFIMDTPSEYTSRTRSIGFGEHPLDAARAAIENQRDYPVQEWPHLNEHILRAERIAAGLDANAPVGGLREALDNEVRSFVANVETAAEDNGTPAVLIDDLWALARDWFRDHAALDSKPECGTCRGEGWVAGISANPLPSGEPGEPYQVQETCPNCGGSSFDPNAMLAAVAAATSSADTKPRPYDLIGEDK